jgi:hypothetical protein
VIASEHFETARHSGTPLTGLIRIIDAHGGGRVSPNA